MRFMNEYDMEMAARRHAGHPVLEAAIETLVNLRNWADANSDGWAYWPKPARSAAKLMELIEGNGTNRAIEEAPQRATPAAYRAAVAPIKAFRTRMARDGMTADFEIVEVAA